MLDKPILVLEQINKRKPRCFTIIKEKADPWFGC
jgi:hypothetical protein